eukprot:scaffold264530_cov19-Tisochrysis_lutea.AAC.1
MLCHLDPTLHTSAGALLVLLCNSLVSLMLFVLVLLCLTPCAALQQPYNELYAPCACAALPDILRCSAAATLYLGQLLIGVQHRPELVVLLCNSNSRPWSFA